jgi:hypothetical protein
MTKVVRIMYLRIGAKLNLLAALLFLLDGAPVTLELVREITSVVTIVVIFGANVIADIVVPGIVLPRMVDRAIVFIADISVTGVFETVSVIVVGTMMETEKIPPGIVEGCTVIGGTVLPGIVVVYVKVTCPPRALAGIAVPTPEAVNCVGIRRVVRSGFADGLSA